MQGKENTEKKVRKKERNMTLYCTIYTVACLRLPTAKKLIWVKTSRTSKFEKR